MARNTYHLVFSDNEKARVAEQALREHGRVESSEHGDGHERLYRVSIRVDRHPPTPYELDRLARRFGGKLVGFGRSSEPPSIE